jgi:predicted sulfurtransferase/23S rRNA-/tRNA-specific pseudouridylate synthase
MKVLKTLAMTTPQQHHILLFYKYHPLSGDRTVTNIYRDALHNLCSALSLTGRILVGVSRSSEGINGTLAGSQQSCLAFTVAMNASDNCVVVETDTQLQKLSSEQLETIRHFWLCSHEFFALIDEPVLTMNSNDFKWSASTIDSEPLFPDLNIKLTNELIGSGGVLSKITIADTGNGYLTPREWHDALTSGADAVGNKDTIVIDCRNTKEYEIGHFPNAVDPQTSTFSQFPKWVKDNAMLLANKNVMMYCTGGIRCEKASAFIRSAVPTVKDVRHLKGGIHKYLEEFGSEGHWKGRNFVFDGRCAASADETRLGRQGNSVNDLSAKDTTGNNASRECVVGSCVACSAPYDQFDPSHVCAVCREPTLVCPDCTGRLLEFHCRQHSHLSTCYFVNLTAFSEEQLKQQFEELGGILSDIAIGRKFKQKRNTLIKQRERILFQLDAYRKGIASSERTTLRCRNCGDNACSGRCWGFYGLKRTELLEKSKQDRVSNDGRNFAGMNVSAASDKQHQLSSKKLKRDLLLKDTEALHLSQPPSFYRSSIGIRVPPCTTRVLRCFTKGKWCGRPVLNVLGEEFVDLSRPAVAQKIIDLGLLRVNDQPVLAANACHTLLKSSDVVSRIVHWHEAPVIVPDTIAVQGVSLPGVVVAQYGLSHDATVFVCDKPSTVPVHPAGPYLSNSLTMMIEAQESLDTFTLNPLHRIDRVTSGLTLCAIDPDVSRVFHRCLLESNVRKLYLAKVYGKFVSVASEWSCLNLEVGSSEWDSIRGVVVVNAPVETVDPANGLRAVTLEGKPSRSLFRFEAYDSDADTSIISCCPVSGRNHQLRLHLKLLGFPIVGDIQYGGEKYPSDIDLRSISLELMKQAVTANNDHSSCLNLPLSDVIAAKQACSSCSGGETGIACSFTSSQLLAGGHSICLHALRYQIQFPPKKQKAKTADNDTIAIATYQVSLPSWATSVGEREIPWL